MNIGLLISGKLGLETLVHVYTLYTVKAVLTDKLSTEIIEYCESKGLPIFVGNPRKGKARDFIDTIDIDVLLSVNYLYIIEKDLIEWPRRMAVNLHGSLLPRYRGRTPHVWAIINNEKETGITAHVIDEGCDTGDILYQVSIPIGPMDTGADILNQYLKIYPEVVESVLKQIETGTEKRIPQREENATYFSKRTPADGLINWQWQKERIYNWIRAQASPYPGAHSYYKKQKVVINRIQFSDYGFKDIIPNGTILAIDDDNPIIKVSNGAIMLLDYSKEFETPFKVNDQFDQLC